MKARTSGPRLAALVIASVLGVVAWLGAIVIWTSTGRVADQGGFVDVTVETIQSPPGMTAVTGAVMTVVDGHATATNLTISPQAREEIRAQVGQVLGGGSLRDLLAPAIARAREAYQAAPAGPITFDLAALRPEAEARIRAVDPVLLRAIPPADELVVTVPAAEVPSIATTVASRLDALRWIPLWLALGAIALIGIALLISLDRHRTARRIGIALLAIAVVPLLLRLVVPWVMGAATGAGNPREIAEVAAIAIIANWWIALLVSAGAGLLLLVPALVAPRGPRPRRGPVVLGR